MGKTKVTFICSYMGKKNWTQDFVDENGRKDAQHCKERAGACLGYRKNGSECDWKKKHSEGQEQLLSELQQCLYSACLFSVLMWYLGANQRERGGLRIKVFNNILLNSQAFYFLQLSLPSRPNFHYKALHPVNFQGQYSTLPPPSQVPQACKDTEQLKCYQGHRN